MADEILPPPPIPTDIDVGLPVDDARVDHVLFSEVTAALTAQSIKDFGNSSQMDRISPAWVNQQKTNMRNARYQTIADYQARKAREAKNGQE